MNAPLPRPQGFLYAPMFPLAPLTHALEAAADRGRAHRHLRRRDRAAHRPRGAERTGLPGLPRRVAPAAPRPSGAAARDPRRPRGVGQRPLRRARSAEERQHRRRRRAADVPGHRHRARVRQEGPARLGRRQRGGGAVLRRAPHLHRNQSALFADGAAVDVRGGEHRQQPAGAVRHHGRPGRGPRRRVPPDVRRQGRRLGQQDASCSRRPARSCRPSGWRNSSKRRSGRSAPRPARPTTWRS